MDKGTTMDTSYNVYDRDGNALITDASLHDAATTILTHDDYGYEIRKDDGGGWTLWVTLASRSAPYGGKLMVRSWFWSLEEDREAAEREIFGKVIRRSDAFSGIVVSSREKHHA